MKSKRAAVYIRISTNEQNPDLQKHELPEYCQRRGWQAVDTYIDTISGGKDRRPALDRLMADGKRRKFDVVGRGDVHDIAGGPGFQFTHPFPKVSGR